MGRHTAWNTFVATGKNPPKHRTVVLKDDEFKCTMRNVELWLIEECGVCRGDFDEGQVVKKMGNQLVHGECAT